MNEIMNEVRKYEAELGEVNKRLQELEDQRVRITRVGVRLEGVLAYLNTKLQDAKLQDAKSESAPQAPAADQASAPTTNATPADPAAA